MTLTSNTRIAIWDEPAGATARGTLILLPGRGETATSYQRFGKRLSADAYKVRLVDVALDDLAGARSEVEKVIADRSLPSPKVLVGADSGATLAATLIDHIDADAAVIAGLVLPDSAQVKDWEEEVEARTACPVHRQVISDDTAFERGSLAAPLPGPWADLDLPATAKPVLVIHGTVDPITSPGQAFAAYAGLSTAQRRVVAGGRHDILNDVSHRSVAATIVLFLESLKLGSSLPAIVTEA